MEPDYNLIGTSIDLRQIDPISQKRLLAFFNFWLSQTVRLLNECVVQFETKLFDIDNRLRRVEASMTLLEAKLASVPGLSATEATAVPKAPALAENGVEERAEAPIKHVEMKEQEQAQAGVEETAPKAPEEDVSKDPRYAKYFKMVLMGVPEDAVKQKMELEGVDPSILQKGVPRSSTAPTSASEPKRTVQEDKESSESFSESDDGSFSD